MPNFHKEISAIYFTLNIHQYWHSSRHPSINACCGMHSTKSEPNVNCGLGVMVPCQGWAIHWCRMSRAGQAMRVGDEGCV